MLILDHPKNVAIVGDTTVIEGYSVKLICSTDAKPGVNRYLWTYPGGTSEEETLLLEAVAIENAGTFTCQATNEFTTCNQQPQSDGESKSVDVIVHCMHTQKLLKVLFAIFK